MGVLPVAAGLLDVPDLGLGRTGDRLAICDLGLSDPGLDAELATQAIDIGPVVAVAVESAMPSSTASGVSISLETSDPPYIVDADAERIGQVCDNLISNALKFTPRGGTVTVRVENVGDKVVITFTDTGDNYRLTLRNGVLVYRKVTADPATAPATVTLANKLRLLMFAAGDATSPGLEITGDADALPSLVAVLDRPDPDFDIITP